MQSRPSFFLILLRVFVRLGLGLVLLVGLCVVMGGLARPAHAATTITVNTTADELISDGNCSLREAIQAANTDTAVDACPAGSGADTIVVPAGTYTLSSGELDITADLTINGAGSATTIIDGGGLGRVFHILGVTVDISGLTIQNGSTGGDLSGGGGIKNEGGTLTLNNSTVSGNTACQGGGIFNGPELAGGTLTLNNSTVSGNQNPCGGRGGGIRNDGTLTLNNSTVSGNTATVGAGIDNFVRGTSTLNNSTVSGNTGGRGAGISAELGGSSTLKDTIVANNTPDDCIGSITSAGYNLSSDSTCGFTAPGDLQNTDPLLGSLADNGGPTQTLALRDGSPAINHIPNSACTVTTDQRGIARPQGPACDIGAFEFRVPKLNLPSTITVDATSPQGASVTYTVRASEPDDASATPTVSCTPASGSTFPIGTTTVNCTASDAASPPDTTRGSFQVVVKGAAAQVNDLISLVNSFHLSRNLQTALDNKLQDVLTAINAGQTATACSELTDFIGHVQSQSGKGLTQSQANQLIAAAKQIQAVLAC